MCRLWDYIPFDYTGPPQWYVVHAWSGSLCELVDCLVDLMAGWDGGDGRPSKESLGNVILWLGE
jgi:hypothetical protein